MKVRLPDGRIIDNVPKGMSKAELLYKIRTIDLQKQDPEYTPDTGAFDAGLVSAGNTIMNMGRGGRNLYAKATGDQEMQEEIAAESQEAERYMEPLREAHPAATFVGSMAPGMATLPLSGGLLSQMIAGGALGMSEYNEDQGLQGLIGAGLSGMGHGIGSGVSRMIGSKTRPPPRVTGEAGRLLDRADDMGLMVMPGNRTGSLPFKQLDASIKSTPIASGIVEPGMEANQRTLNRLAAESIGEAGDEIAPSTLGSAATRIGKLYDDVLEGVDDIPVDQGRLINFMDSASTDTSTVINDYLRRFPGLDSGRLSTTEWAALRQAVAKDVRNAWSQRPAIADDLNTFEDLLLDSLEDVAPTDIRATLRTAGNQWRNLKALERGKTVSKGNVNPLSLDTGLRSADKRGYLRGGNESDYYDAVRAANMFSDVVGDSGTNTRSWLSRVVENPAMVPQGLAMRPFVQNYIDSGGSGLSAGLLGAVPSSPIGTQSGATMFRSGLLGEY